MKENGFTLIELIVVIVILGILATTVAPKYIDLEADAHTATLQAIKASMEGATALVHGKSLVKGNHKLKDTNPNATVNIGDAIDDGNGVGELVVNYGYPVAYEDDWLRLIDFDSSIYGFESTTDGQTVIIYLIKNGKPTGPSDSCITYFTQSSGESVKPEINTNSC